MRGWSFPAGKLFGVDIRIHITFLFLLGGAANDKVNVGAPFWPGFG